MTVLFREVINMCVCVQTDSKENIFMNKRRDNNMCEREGVLCSHQFPKVLIILIVSFVPMLSSFFVEIRDNGLERIDCEMVHGTKSVLDPLERLFFGKFSVHKSDGND